MKIGLVVLDTLRYDVFDEIFENTIARADFEFERLYSTSRWTVPAHASLFTGYYPTEVGTHSGNQHLTTAQPTLAERFRDADYTTVGASNNPYIDSFFGFDRGFETFERGPALQGRPAISSGFDWPGLFSDLPNDLRKFPIATAEIIQSDAPTFKTLWNGLKFVRTSDPMAGTETVGWLFDSIDRIPDSVSDLFFFANVMTCHSPYNPPAEYRTVEPYDTDPLELTLRDEPVSESEHERHWESYRDCARYLDDELPRLIDAVDWDALFIISDHGELFGEYGLRQHQYGMYEELVHVPGIAFGNDVPTGSDTSLSSLLDIHRTILDLAEIDSGPQVRGYNRFDPDTNREHIYAESVGNYRYSPDAKGIDAKIPESWSKPHYMYGEKCFRFISDKEGERVFDVLSGEKKQEEAHRLQSTATEFRENRVDVAGTSVNTDIPDEIEARLEHLGYR